MQVCSIDGCEKKVLCKGWCSTHYQRWQTHGDPMFSARAASGSLKRWVEEHSDHQGDECLPWPFSRAKDGRPVTVIVDGVRMIAHRYMCILRHGPPPSSIHQTAHSCGMGHNACMNPAHLRWATGSENQSDREAHGTSNIGAQHPGAKLTKEIVEEIRSLNGLEMQKVTALRFGVTRSHIANLQSGKLWRK